MYKRQTVHNLGKVTGEKGDAGKDGQDGSNGNGIQSAEIDADGNLIITFTAVSYTHLDVYKRQRWKSPMQTATALL